MGKTRSRDGRSKTLPSSPSHTLTLSSSSSSDFEFSISQSPHKSSSTNFCPADELFFKGQILPLHLSPRLSMVQTLSLSLSSSSSTTTSRDSTSSSNDIFLLTESCDSSRPSSVTEEDELKRFSNFSNNYHQLLINSQNPQIKKPATNVFKRFSNVFRKDSTTKNSGDQENLQQGSNSVKRASQSAKEMMRKYLKKVKPFYEKLSSQNKQQQQQQQQQQSATVLNARKELNRGLSQSFSESLRFPRRRNDCVLSCPSSMRSSPNRVIGTSGNTNGGLYSSKSSSMEELQSAIQGAIAHCKNSMVS